MLIILLVGVVGMFVLFLTAATVILAASGQWRWDPVTSRIAKTIFGSGYVLGILGGVVWLGPSVVVATWPTLLAVLGIAALVFIVLDMANGFGLRPSSVTPRAPTNAQWDAMWLAHEGKPLPPWMLQAALSGEVRYAGKVAQVKNGILVPAAASSSPGLSLTALFDRLDRLL